MLKHVCFLVLVVLGFGSCKNDLEVNAPYKELPTVYAVLCPQEKLQTIRINKVFLGEGDAYAMAKISDSVNYPQGELEVALTRYINDSQVDATPYPDAEGDKKKIVFHDSVITNVAEGAFSTTQRIYVSSERLFTTGQYKLTITNRHTGNVFTARANSLDSLQTNHAVFPPITKDPHYPYPPGLQNGDYIDYSTSYTQYVRFVPDGISKIYQIKIRTHWLDSTATTKTDNFVDYDFDTRDERTKTKKFGMELMETQFRGVDYWNAVGVALSRKNLTNIGIFGRRAYIIEYFVYSSTQEYLDFLQYNAPSFAITQNTGIYSNFDNKAAMGIFTFRARYSVKKEPLTFMVNEFARNPNTCPYRFVDSEGNINTACQ